jgi:hypothetical protein
VIGLPFNPDDEDEIFLRGTSVDFQRATWHYIPELPQSEPRILHNILIVTKINYPVQTAFVTKKNNGTYASITEVNYQDSICYREEKIHVAAGYFPS